MKGKRGLSLVEMVVATGILAIVVVSTSTLISQFSKAQKLVSSRDETNEFVTAFSKFLQDPATCKAALVTVPPKFLTNNFGNISIANFGAYNSDAYDPPAVPPPLGAGFLITKKVRISELQITQKPVAAPGVPFEFAYRLGADNMYRTIAQIRLTTGTFENDPNDFRGNPRRYFEIPVIVRGNVLPARIVDCTGAVDMEKACKAAGGIMSGTVCDLAALGGPNCKLRGSYIIYSDSDPGNTYANMQSPNATNPYTGSTTCPPGSVAKQTGQRVWTNNYSCGKKCTAGVNYTELYFTCMIC